ncbi:MAG: hypothetical protein KGV57_01730 [Fusobacterium sp.]|nr:hypothetical protein [Fusobacterium sp.]
MDTVVEEKIKKISDYGREIALQQLLKAYNTRTILGKKGDLSGVEKLDNEVVPIYEKIYNFSDFENLKNILEEEKDKIENIEKFLKNIAKDNKLEEKFLLEQIELRKKLSGKSGAEVVKKFLKYRLKEYKKINANYLEKINKVLDEEEKLNLDLSNSIQEKEQIKVLEKLNPVRKKYQTLVKQFEIYQLEIEETEKKLKNKWNFEIYGILEEEELLKVYENFFNIKNN